MKGALESLDACRKRQAETGQLVPRMKKDSSDHQGSRPMLTESGISIEQMTEEPLWPVRGKQPPIVSDALGGRSSAAGLGITDQTPTNKSRLESAPGEVNTAADDHSPFSRIGLTGASHINTTSRKINTGFEILPFGTLAAATPVKEWGTARNIGLKSGQVDGRPNKLQKRRNSEPYSRD